MTILALTICVSSKLNTQKHYYIFKFFFFCSPYNSFSVRKPLEWVFSVILYFIFCNNIKEIQVRK